MTTRKLRALAALAVGAAMISAAPAEAHPDACSKDAAVQSGWAFTGASAFTSLTSTPWAEHAREEGCFTDEQIATFDDSGAGLGVGETGSSRNMTLLANLPKSGPFAGESAFNSDIAFWGQYAIQGNYNGFQITDISEPESPRIVSQVSCPGSQNDVSVWKDLIVLSTDSRRSDDSCSSFALSSTTTPSSTDPEAEYWEGIKVFDWSNPAEPRLVSTVETDCGSHTHTIIPESDRLVVYVSSYDLNANAKDCRLTDTPADDHDKISIVEVPLADPQDARVIAEPVLFPDGGFEGNSYTRQTRGCHDITVYPALGLAAGACMGEGILLDITDPENPRVLSSVTDPNFAFWHSATFTNDGSRVLFTDELGGGGSPTCNPTIGPQRGADIVYDITDRGAPAFLSYFKIDRVQTNTENCVAHNGVMLPTSKKDVFVQAWYQGGTSVIDLSDPAAPREIAWFDRGPISADRLVLGGSWSSYWYNGKIYSNDIQQGLDVLNFAGAERSGARRLPYLNAQVQEPVR